MSLKLSYITSMYSPYRCENVWKIVREIIKEDYEYVSTTLKNHDFEYLIALVIVMFLSLMKCITFVFQNLKKPKMKGND